MGTRTMAHLSYGISTPADLFEKLGRDGAKLTAVPDPDDVFNFFVTKHFCYPFSQSRSRDQEL